MIESESPRQFVESINRATKERPCERHLALSFQTKHGSCDCNWQLAQSSGSDQAVLRVNDNDVKSL